MSRRQWTARRRVIQVGSPTDLTILDDGTVVDRHGNPIKTIPFKEWIKKRVTPKNDGEE